MKQTTKTPPNQQTLAVIVVVFPCRLSKTPNTTTPPTHGIWTCCPPVFRSPDCRHRPTFSGWAYRQFPTITHHPSFFSFLSAWVCLLHVHFRVLFTSYSAVYFLLRRFIIITTSLCPVLRFHFPTSSAFPIDQPPLRTTYTHSRITTINTWAQ